MKLTKAQVECLRYAAKRSDGRFYTYGLQHRTLKDKLHSEGAITLDLDVADEAVRQELTDGRDHAIIAATGHLNAGDWEKARVELNIAADKDARLKAKVWYITEAGRKAVEL